MQFEWAILREHANLVDTGIRAVAEWEVDDAVLAAERHRWLRDVLRQRSQTASLAARQNHCQAFSLSHNNYPPMVSKTTRSGAFASCTLWTNAVIGHIIADIT